MTVAFDTDVIVQWHLVLRAYLQRIVNSGGRTEGEFAVGTGAADV